MSMSSSSREVSVRAHRAALALNNMAVHLMERGHCGRALKTFRDSLSLLHIALAPPSTDSPQDGKAVHEFSTKVFQVASQRYVASWSERDASDRLICEFNIVDEDDFHSLRAAAKYGPSASLLFPLRISESCVGATRDFAEITRQLGIIQYNHGVVNFLLSLQRGERKTGKFLEESSKSLAKAEKVFAALTKETHGDNAEHSWVLFSSIALNCLSIVYQSQNKRGKAEEAEKAGLVLYTNMEENYIMEVLSQRQTCAAAA